MKEKKENYECHMTMELNKTPPEPANNSTQISLTFSRKSFTEPPRLVKMVCGHGVWFVNDEF